MSIKKAIKDLEAWCESNCWFQLMSGCLAFTLAFAYAVAQLLYYLFDIEPRMVVFALTHFAGLALTAAYGKRICRWYLTKVKK